MVASQRPPSYLASRFTRTAAGPGRTGDGFSSFPVAARSIALTVRYRLAAGPAWPEASADLRASQHRRLLTAPSTTTTVVRCNRK